MDVDEQVLVDLQSSVTASQIPEQTIVNLEECFTCPTDQQAQRQEQQQPGDDVPPPNIEAEPEVDPALPNTDDEDVVVAVVVVVAVPPNTEGEEIVEPIVK